MNQARRSWMSEIGDFRLQMNVHVSISGSLITVGETRMRIGIPREIKTLEGRVGLVPSACLALLGDGHEVFIEHDAGRKAGFPDDDYRAVGVQVVADAPALFATAELIVKVKEPQASELALLGPQHLLFGYLHLAGDVDLARQLADTGCTAIAFETVRDASGGLPLLAPMSHIAGRLAVLHGGSFLLAPNGGRGVLLGGYAPGQQDRGEQGRGEQGRGEQGLGEQGLGERGRVTVIGGGVAGSSAVATAAALGADVTVFDIQAEKREALRALGSNVTVRDPRDADLGAAVADSDLVIGAVLIPGARAPHVVSAGMVRAMRSGSVVVDVSIDQGGCIESIRPTSYAAPTFVWEQVIHYGVTNMPGAVPHTASLALSTAITASVQELAAGAWDDGGTLTRAVNVRDGKVVHPKVLEAMGGQE